MHFEIKLIKVSVAGPVARRKQNNTARGTDSTDDNMTYTYGWVCFALANVAQRKSRRNINIS